VCPRVGGHERGKPPAGRTVEVRLGVAEADKTEPLPHPWLTGAKLVAAALALAALWRRFRPARRIRIEPMSEAWLRDHEVLSGREPDR
jgi:hypothetical protein